MIIKIHLTILLLILFSVAVCSASEYTSPVSGLLADNFPARQHTCDLISQERETWIKELISIVETRKDDKYEGDPAHMAMIMLGELRAEEAIHVLYSKLKLVPVSKDGRYRFRSKPLEEFHPAAVALVKIGEPSIDMMVRTLQLSKDKEERNLAAWVIMRLEGVEQATHRLDVLIKNLPQYKDKSNPYKQRLTEAKDYIKTYNPIMGHPLLPKSWFISENGNIKYLNKPSENSKPVEQEK